MKQLTRNEIWEIINDLDVIELIGDGSSVYRETFEIPIMTCFLLSFDVIMIADFKGSKSRQIGDRIVFEPDYDFEVEVEDAAILLDGESIIDDNHYFYLKDLIMEKIQLPD